MTEALEPIDFLTRSKVRVEATAEAVWPHIVDVADWRAAGGWCT